jgi:tetratricopeptide (TPR) repeat protein
LASWTFPILLGNIQGALGDIDKAVSYTHEAIELSIKMSSMSAEGIAKLSMGRVLGKNKALDNHEALRYILEGKKICDELQLRPQIVDGYFYLGELYSDSGEYEKALEQLKRAEGEYQAMGIDYSLSFCKSLIGKVLSKIDPSQFNQSERSIFDAINIAQQIESKPALAMGHLCLGEIYADNGQKEKAMENLKKAESMYGEMKMVLWLGKTPELLDKLL